MNKLPPHSEQFERALLGSIIANPANLSKAIKARIEPDTFYSPKNKTIFTRLVEMSEKDAPIDLLTLTQSLADSGSLGEAGGAAYLTESFAEAAGPANVGWIIEQLREKHRRRVLINGLQELERIAYDEEDFQEVIETTQKTLLLTAKEEEVEREKSMKDHVHDALDRFEATHAQGLAGISTGIPDIDRAIGGLQRQDMVVIAGPEKSGKTSLALNVIEHVSIDLQKTVALFSLEMNGREIAERLMCSRSRVNLHQINQGIQTDSTISRLMQAAPVIAGSKLIIRDEANMSIAYIRSASRLIKAEHPDLALIVIDYAQLVKAIGKHNSREQEVAEVSRSTKQLAKELDIPIIILSQLNEKGQMRESRALQQDANSALIVSHVEDNDNLRNIIIPFARSAPRQKIQMIFEKEFFRFKGMNQKNH